MAEPDPKTGQAQQAQDTRRYRANLQGEIDGVAVYSALAKAEPDPNLAKVYAKLAAVESAHAEFWRSQLDRKGARRPGLLYR